MATLPLEGIRVINLGHMGTAPLTGVWLADWGAEVIKVESNMKPDQTRFLVTLKPGLPYEDMVDSGMQFNDWNRGAKSCLANLKKPEAIALIKKLVKISDVVMENHAPGAMKNLGLDYESLAKVNPKIIYISMSAMGQDGPMHDIVTFGATIASLTGLQSMQGYEDGEASIDFGMADCVGSTYAAFLVCSALRYRDRAGEGQYIDMGQVAPMFAALGEPTMDCVMNDRIPGMMGNRRKGFCPNNTYRCRPNAMIELLPKDDEWIAISVENEQQWLCLCEVMGNPAWTKEEKFADPVKRWHNQDELDGFISEWTVKWDKAELLIMLQNAGVPAMYILNAQERAYDPQIRARRYYIPRDVKVIKDLPMKGPGIEISGYDPVLGVGPNLGGANDYVYGELLGLSKEEIEKLKKEGVIV